MKIAGLTYTGNEFYHQQVLSFLVSSHPTEGTMPLQAESKVSNC